MSLQRVIEGVDLMVSVGMRDGSARNGLLNRFDPLAAFVDLRLVTKGVDEVLHESDECLPVDQIAYVAFYRKTHEVGTTPSEERSEFDIVTQTPRPVRFAVKADPLVVTDPLGFYAYPLSATGVFNEFFFFRGGVARRVDRKLIGEVLVSRGSTTPAAVEAGLVRQMSERNFSVADALVAQDPDREKQLLQALARMDTPEHARTRVDLVQVLVEEGLVTAEDIRYAQEEQKLHANKRLGELLVEMNAIGEDDVAAALAQKFQVPFLDLANCQVDPEVVRLVPGSIIRRYGVLPVCQDRNGVVIAFGDPEALEAIDMLRFFIGKRVVEVIAAPSEIRAAAEPFLASEDTEVDKRTPASGEAQAEDHGEGQDDSDAIIKLTERILREGYAGGASDVHIEPNGHEHDLLVRFRVDGVCREHRRLPASFRRPLVTRLKVLADLDIAERRRPQDGKIRLDIDGKKVELRLAIVPTEGGDEDAVLRILAGGGPIPLEKLDLGEANLATVRRSVEKPYGLILAVGPTGSGKTTTLHSLIAVINNGERKIWTAEDPVEITQPGLRQVQVNRKVDLTFASAMRAFLRADPDVIMVGEMRDHETAAIGIEASLTGHLVFSTLHTNNAPETITRLLDMGMDPFTFSDALIMVLAQRLARRLCPACRRKKPATPEEHARVAGLYGAEALEARLNGQVLELWTGRGCERCGGTGYKGRLGLHEVLANSPAVRDAVQHKAGAAEIRALAVSEGLRTLVQDGLDKCLEGLTDLRQVLAVCGE